MNPKEAITKLESSDIYKNWQKQNEGYYLVHVFYMTGHPVQIGYYSEKSDNMITFDVSDTIVINPASEVFKESSTVSRLNMDVVTITLDDAMEKVKATADENYPGEKSGKDMIILQDINGQIVFNATLFTDSFKTLNVKIDAKTGEVISHSLDSLISF